VPHAPGPLVPSRSAQAVDGSPATHSENNDCENSILPSSSAALVLASHAPPSFSKKSSQALAPETNPQRAHSVQTVTGSRSQAVS
jgi:hypothetical protein